MEFVSFEDYFDIKEVLQFSDVKFEQISEGKRLSDYVAPLDESSYEEYQSLNESQKYDVDNVLWESILFCALNDEELNEGFFKNVISGISSMSKKALKYAKTVISNIGQLFKDLGKWVMSFLSAAADKGKEAAKKVFAGIKDKLSKKEIKKKLDPKALKQDMADLENTVTWLTDKAISKLVKSDASDAADAIKQAAKENPEEAKDLDQTITKELKGSGDKKKAKNESLIELSIINTINEIRKDKDFDLGELVETAASYNELLLINESNPDDNPAEAAEEKKSSLMSKLAKGLKKIIGIMTSGVVKLYEWVAEWVLKKGFKKVTSWTAKFGGPGPYEFAAIATLITIATAMMLEFGMSLLKDAIGANAVEGIVHALHATNPAHILGHAAEHAVPGAGSVISGVAIAIVVFQAVEHLQHGLKGHEEH